MTSISAIPDIIRRSIFISEEENTKKNLHPHINKYQYFFSGLKIKDDYFTVKSVIAIDQNNNRYYDHKLFNIEKSLLIDSLSKERGSFGVHTSYTQTTAPQKSSSIFNDKRLYEICQCPTNSNCKEFLFSSCFIQSLQVTSAVKYRMKHRSDVLSNKRN